MFKVGDRVVYIGNCPDWDVYYGKPSVVAYAPRNFELSTTFDSPINDIAGLYANEKDFIYEKLFKSKLYKALK